MGLLERLKSRLSQLSITVEIAPPPPSRTAVRTTTVRLTRGSSSQVYTLLYGPVIRPADTGRVLNLDTPALVFTTFVAPRSAESLRRVGAQYLDIAGNAWVEFGEVLIDIRGRPRPPHARTSKQPTAHNLFSAGRSRVAFALLAWPYLWDAPLRKLAHVAGVSLGQAHDSYNLFTKAGYKPTDTNRTRTNLLDHWATSLPTGLAPKIEIATFNGDPRSVQKVKPDDPVFVSGEAAVRDLLQPTKLNLYVEDFNPRMAILNRWRSDEHINIIVRRKFWQAPDNSDEPLTGLRPAPWPLTYADLANSDDPRVRNVASEWRERFAGIG